VLVDHRELVESPKSWSCPVAKSQLPHAHKAEQHRLRASRFAPRMCWSSIGAKRERRSPHGVDCLNERPDSHEGNAGAAPLDASVDASSDMPTHGHRVLARSVHALSRRPRGKQKRAEGPAGRVLLVQPSGPSGSREAVALGRRGARRLGHTMTMVKPSVLVLPLVLALVAGAGVALATRGAVGAVKPADIAATRTYLRAEHRYEQAIKGDGPADAAALHSLVGHVSSGCPKVLVGAPPSKTTEEITREADLEVEHALEEPQRNATIAFAKKIERLRWTNRKLTYYVHGFAAESRATAELAAPDICVDARAVAGSGFKTIPANTTRYALQHLCASSKVEVENSPGETGELDEIIGIMIKPYERPSERALIPRRLSKREREKKEELDFQRSAASESEIANALGLPKAAPPLPLSNAPTCLSPPPR
jgi:hypothetical protein